jgi:hypothetical protein
VVSRFGLARGPLAGESAAGVIGTVALDSRRLHPGDVFRILRKRVTPDGFNPPLELHNLL